MLEKVERFAERLYEDRIQNEYDAVIPVVGDEGEGKSTFISEFGFIYQDVRDGERDPDRLLDQMLFTRSDVQEAISTAPKQSLLAIPDAARVFHRKEAMVGEQRELEKDFFDVRSSEYVILLGYQDWDSIPSFLQERRAQFAFYIPRRGLLRGYNRQSLNKKANSNYDYDWWPEADLTDRFPPLDGTDYWDRYQTLDDEMKNERMGGDEENLSTDDAQRREAIKTALRATQPWDDDSGMTYREASKLIDYSPTWVSNVVQDYRDGMYQNLVNKEEVKMI